MITNQDITSNYELFFSKVSGYSDYVFKPTDKEKVMITNFIKLLDKKYDINTVGKNFIFEYFSFQFSIKHDRKTRFGKGIIPFNNVVGPKSLEEWNNRDIETWKYYSDMFLDKFNISQPEEKINKSEIKGIEDIERQRFYGTEEGFVNCFFNDISFSMRSKYCITCKFKINCKHL